MKYGDQVYVWNGEKTATHLQDYNTCRPDKVHRPGDIWMFIQYIDDTLAKHLADNRARYICIRTKSRSGGNVVGVPVLWEHAEKITKGEIG